jgi:acyl carrier protein
MKDRKPLTSEQFGADFFLPEQMSIATGLRNILATILIIDVTRIYPDDRLIEDLGLGQVDGMDGNWLEFDIRDIFGVDLVPGWDAIKTVRDLVEYVSSQCPTE